MSDIIVAVDGPAGSGKSSVSKEAALRLGWAYLDTGAAYRALAWHCLDEGVDTEDADAVVARLADFDYSIGMDPQHYFVRVGGEEITRDIREPRVSAVVSHIARVPEVRVGLNDLFRRLMAENPKDGVIVEGRDITTVVAPDAPVRVLLTASAEARMARRSAELSAVSAEATAQQLASRDAQDSRVVDFMNAAEGVTTLDSTDLDFEQTVLALLDIVHARTP
ncbi:MAG: (d)CMP kinase [Microcella pacifica]|jgi:cytidylate kinase|uniref:Cytidylate kinase n=1 Tax=Microcella pacifica TaxID=2591847 RepID=A0A9E5JQY3_9MICO|nr:(d)CMP kinase [Microcella pacifica]MBR22979.1 cytidylate kinase [Leifsonia sp.]MBU1251468.1 (d)CMP kinase [Actinomycetota bacterium]MBU1609220.1 (d)CMP kinase [Actinomycetota bacterium]MBU2314795.1 (d)CMP kinase [Actinomycetota bacterium]MBU2385010.1 (d)CMP kinase [Actinomycetota bacterium]